MAEPFTEAELAGALQALDGWETMGWKSAEEIRKTFRFASFHEAWDFLVSLPGVAVGEEDHLNVEVHHPGTSGRTPVRVSLGDRGVVTQDDLDIAQRIEDQLRSS